MRLWLEPRCEGSDETHNFMAADVYYEDRGKGDRAVIDLKDYNELLAAHHELLKTLSNIEHFAQRALKADCDRETAISAGDKNE